MDTFLFHFQQILKIWYWEHCTGGITTETFLRILKNWECAGFIRNNVWSDMGDIVDSDTRRSIETGDNISKEDEFVNLTEDDTITDRVLSCASRSIVASRKLQFVLEILRLKYYQINIGLPGDEMKSNLEVCHQYKVF